MMAAARRTVAVAVAMAVAVAVAVLAWPTAAAAAPVARKGLGGLEGKPFDALSDRNVTEAGRTALAIRAQDWRHAETDHFVYHFFRDFIAGQVAVEAEYYYRVISAELKRDTKAWERKCHIFVFETPADWTTFQARFGLDPWTGGIHRGDELFVLRDAAMKWKGHGLGHEVTHLIVHRFFGTGVPLWLNEGYAEHASIRAYFAYFRARGYTGKPRSPAVKPEDYIPLAELVNLVGYPPAANKLAAFYIESHRLVRFLDGLGRDRFLALFEALAKGNRIETALGSAFGLRFNGLDALNREFRPYAEKGHDDVIGEK